MFVRPSKLGPGKWQLFEYYSEPGRELENVKEDELKTRKEHLNLEFDVDNKFSKSSTLTVALFSGLESGTWSTAKNYISLIHPSDFRQTVEFQFAIEKGVLKLVKKVSLWKIEFFGFFERLN